MPNPSNIERPIAFLGLGRSGTSAITEIMSHHPQIDNVGEVSPVIWDICEGVRLANMNMRHPTPREGSLSRSSLAASAVRGFFLGNYHSERSSWVMKPIGPISRVRDRFASRASDEEFLDWYFGVFDDCFPEARIYCLVRDPIQYARSARRYWGASFRAVMDDLAFMSVILKSGRLPPDRFISMGAFREAPADIIARILRECGLDEHTFDEALYGVQYAAEQGKAIAGESGGTDIPPFTTAEERKLWSVVGEEYRPFLSAAWKFDDAPKDDEPDSVVDYRQRYLALVDEFNFLKTKGAGLEKLVNEKEDIVQNLLTWTKSLEAKIASSTSTPKPGEEKLARNPALELKIDYPPDFEIRWGYGKPNAKFIQDIIDANLGEQNSFLRAVHGQRKALENISVASGPDAKTPHWDNGWFPPLDGASLYTMVATKRPSKFIEIGSGNSTKFARKAISDKKLKTKITSIDPQPRAEIDEIADVVLRYPLEKVDLDVFEGTKADDVVFFDGSHRAFQNSDVTVFFTEVIPRLPVGVIVGIHDMFWPFDYPAPWKDRAYNEQYMLAAYMIGRGKNFKCIMPSAFITRHKQEVVQSFFSDEVNDHYKQKTGYIGGSAFWFRT